MFTEFIKLALQSMVTSKLRTLLSLLGIVIGVASVITIVNLGESASKSIQADIAAAGVETISVSPRTRDREVRRTFDLEMADRIRSEIPGVYRIIPTHQFNTTVRFQNRTYDGTVMGVSDEYAETMDYQAAEGAFFSDMDNEEFRQVAVLGSLAAEDLFPDGGGVGEYIRIMRGGTARTFRVAGIMEEKSSSFNIQFNQNVYIPYNTYANRVTSIDFVRSYLIRTEEGADVLAVADEIDEFLERVVGSGHYYIFTPSTIADMASSITNTLSMVLASIAAISLLVGGIGIMNIMLVSVAERTTEIGIRKAIGASPRRILTQFLIEAVTLTLVGGILGIAAGIGLSSAAVRFFDWSFYPMVNIYFLAAGFSMAVGGFFGLYPAVKAAKLDPIEALNYE